MIYLLRLGVDVDDIAVERSDAMGQQTTGDGLHKIDDSTKKIEATPVSAIWPQCLWPVSGGVLKRYLGSFDLKANPTITAIRPQMST
jgi:hypothetical protein